MKKKGAIIFDPYTPPTSSIETRANLVSEAVEKVLDDFNMGEQEKKQFEKALKTPRMNPRQRPMDSKNGSQTNRMIVA